jgi:hypothetical protein
LAINVSARNPELLDVVCEAVLTVATNVYCSAHEDDALNVVVFGVKGDSGTDYVKQLQRAINVDEATLVDLEFSIEGLKRWGQEKKGKNGSKRPKKKSNKKKGGRR